MEKQEIIVQPFTWDAIDNFGDEGLVEIRAWCFDKDNRPYLVRIKDYHPTCYIQLPNTIDGIKMEWFKRDIDEFMVTLIQKLSPNDKFPDSEPPIDYEFVKKPLLYYYNNIKYPMIYLTFNNLKSLKNCTRLLSRPFYFKGKGQAKIEVWETQIPLLRKMLTSVNLEPSQWFKADVRKIKPENKISRLENEYIISYDKIIPLDNKTTSGWQTRPKILVFDIEVYSKNHKAFPDKLNASDVCYMISVITQRYNLPETRKRHLIIFGDCHDVSGCEIIRVKSELECINAFSDLVVKEDPDVISGYNHHGFDNDYMNTRLERIMEEWREMGRLVGEKATMDTISWASTAYGYNELKIIKMSGRISIDILPVIRRDYKLPKYSLDTVSNFFLGRGKHSVKPEDIFKAYHEQNLATKAYQETPNQDNKIRYDRALDEMTRIVKYCIEDAEITLDLAEKIHIWIASVELSNIVGVSIMDLYNRGQQIRCLSKIYDEAFHQGYVVDFREALNVVFNGGAVEKPEPGVTDECPFYDVNSMYPSIIISGNICYTTFVPDHLANTVKDEDCNIFEFDQVERPKSKNDKNNEDDFDTEIEIEEGVLVHRKLRFVKPHIRQGIVPKIVKYLVDERKRVKAEIKELENKKKKGEKVDDVMFVVLDRRQNGLKVTGNSFFGFFGAHIGRLPLIEAAMAITGEGRRIAFELKKYLRDKYKAKIIYGDTDSVVPKFNHLEGLPWAEKYAFWKKVEHELSSIFSGITLEMEKITRIINFAAKMYAYLLYDKNGKLDNEPKKVQAKGIVLARRDGTPWVRKHYRDILFNILIKYSNDFNKECESMLSSFQMIINTAIELLENKVNWEDLAKINGLGANYKNPTYQMAVLAEHLRQIGRPTQVGERIQYLICDIPDAKTIGFKMRTIEEYIESQETDNPLKIDVNYYLKNALLMKIDPLWQVGYNNILNKIKNNGYEPKSRKHFVSITDPVKMIVRILEDGNNKEFILSLKTWLKNIIENSTRNVVKKNKIVIKKKNNNKEEVVFIN